MAYDHHQSSWSDVIPELLVSIFNLLETRSDIVSFRSVCMNWRALSVPPSPNVLSPVLPLQLPKSNNPGLSHLSYGNHPLLITARAILLLTPVNASKQTGWVVMAEEVAPGTFQLYHPITGIHFQLPGKHFDIRQFKVTELSRHASLRNSKFFITKFVLHDEAALVLPVKSDMGSLTRLPTSNASNNQSMSVWHTGVWEISLQPHRTWTISLIFDDIERFDGMFVALHNRGMLCAFDCIRDYNYPVIKRGTLAYNQFTNREQCSRRRRLVVDPVSQNLHLVHKENRKCRVYVLNEQQKRWDTVESLGDDTVLFVGVDHCLFARTQQLSGCPGNCVVYVDDSFYPIDDLLRSSLLDSNGVEDRIKVYLLDEKKTNMISHYPELFQLLCLPSSSWFF